MVFVILSGHMAGSKVESSLTFLYKFQKGVGIQAIKSCETSYL